VLLKNVEEAFGENAEKIFFGVCSRIIYVESHAWTI